MRPEREHKGRFFRAFDRGFDGVVRALRPRRARALAAPRAWCSACSRAARPRHAAALPLPYRPASSPTRTRATSSPASSSPTAPRIERTTRSRSEVEEILLGTPGVVGCNLFGGFDALTGTSPAELRLGLRDARALGASAIEKGEDDRRRCSRTCARARRDPGRARASRSTRRRSAASRASAASSSSSRTGGGGTIERARRGDAADDRARRTSSPELRNVFTTVPPERAADLRSTSTASKAKALGVRGERRLRDAPGVHGRHLHQRLRPLRARVPRVSRRPRANFARARRT